MPAAEGRVDRRHVARRVVAPLAAEQDAARADVGETQTAEARVGVVTRTVAVDAAATLALVAWPIAPPAPL